MSSDPTPGFARDEQFVHLHVHSEYSLLDGLGKVNELVARAKTLGMPALALTDHGAMYGAIDFYTAAKDAGIKPIIGVETYVAKRSMRDREAEDKGSSHLLLLARDYTGYQTLVKLVTAAHLEGFYYKPRVDHALLEQHHDGLIITSGCPSGELARAILADDLDAAARVAGYYRDLVGADNYYLELQDHGLADQQKINRGVLELHRRMGIPLIASNDVHYVLPEHADAQEILLCIQTNTTIDDPNRMRMDAANFYLRSAQEMAQVFAEVSDALSNTLRVAEQCNLHIDFNRVLLPELDFIPEGMTADEYLARLARRGLEERYPVVTDEIRNRLEYELSVISKTGFPNYILFVYDYVSWARKRGILCSPRGSGAGSIVLYCLYVADVDPIEYGLTFERFLNPDRIQMPDIDMDFQDDRRDEVIEYVTRKYGSDHVAQIVTFGRLAARAAIRDVGRAMALPLQEVDRVAKLVPTLPVGLTIDRAMENAPDLRTLYDSESHIKRLIDAAKSIEGVARHASTHAAGLVVSQFPLAEIAPVMKTTKGENQVMSQYAMKPLEKIGLLKMDFLGLNNLTIVANTVRLVAQTRAKQIDLATIPLDDAPTYEMLSRGETTGIFQLEGAGMRRWVLELRPANIRHLIAIVALYRPGPMAFIPKYIARKEGRELVEYIHPKLEPILKETYGVIVYQDQVIKGVVAVAGFTMGQADVLRSAMSKKIRDVMAKQRGLFVAGAKKNGILETDANRIWEQIEPFAGYAFPKAHATCYAVLAYQTAYLKTHFPVEYVTALLTSYVADTDKVALTLGECRRLGVMVLPPDINRGGLQFSVEPLPSAGSPLKPTNSSVGQLAMRYGLIAVKNAGEGAIQSIVAEREASGPYRSLNDFCRRVDWRAVNKRVVESLIKCGAMDGFGDRGALLHDLDQTIDAAQQEQRARDAGQFTMFDAMFSAPPAPAAGPSPARVAASKRTTGQRDMLAWEKEVLGYYLTNHPYQQASRYLRERVTADSSQIGEDLKGKRVVIAGVISGIKPLTTKKGERMAAVQLEDLHGSVEVIVFPRCYERTKEAWRMDAVVVIEGKVDADDDRKKVICDRAELFTVPEGEPPPEEPETLAADLAPEEMLQPARNGENGHDQSSYPITEEAPPEDADPDLSAERTPADVLFAECGNSDLAREISSVVDGRPSNCRPRHLLVTIRRRGTDQEDLEVLRQVWRALSASAGQDTYELCVATPTRRTYLSSPGAVTALSSELEFQLATLLGPKCLRVYEAGCSCQDDEQG